MHVRKIFGLFDPLLPWPHLELILYYKIHETSLIIVGVQTLSTSARNNRWILYPKFPLFHSEVYFESEAIGSRQHLYTCRHGWLSLTQLLQQWQQELKVRT